MSYCEESEELFNLFKNTIIKGFKDMDWYFCPDPYQLKLFDDKQFHKNVTHY